MATEQAKAAAAKAAAQAKEEALEKLREFTSAFKQKSVSMMGK